MGRAGRNLLDPVERTDRAFRAEQRRQLILAFIPLVTAAITLVALCASAWRSTH